MQFSHVRFPTPADGDRIVEVLSEEQFLKPHQSIASAMAAVVDGLGVCPGAADEAVRSLGVELGTSVGRLRRTELMQLARTVHRFWRQAVVDRSTPSQPS
jgi:hypothetical protein